MRELFRPKCMGGTADNRENRWLLLNNNFYDWISCFLAVDGSNLLFQTQEQFSRGLGIKQDTLKLQEKRVAQRRRYSDCMNQRIKILFLSQKKYPAKKAGYCVTRKFKEYQS